ncbi:MAG TPA: hypothetical protein VJ960_03655 [Oceanipulchritudo sp.]|nr:hypothetical protein [Oceanipulchritudo sp.]
MAIDYSTALRDPALVFAHPWDVLNEASLTKDQKQAILESWESDAIHLQESEAEGFSGGEGSRLDAVVSALKKLTADQG